MNKDIICSNICGLSSANYGFIKYENNKFRLDEYKWKYFCWFSANNGASKTRLIPFAHWENKTQDEFFSPYYLGSHIYDNGYKKYLLDQLNENYFIILKKMVEIANSYNINVQFDLFDNCQFYINPTASASTKALLSATTPWRWNENKCNSYYDSLNLSKLWVDKIITTLKGMNVSYSIGNELAVIGGMDKCIDWAEEIIRMLLNSGVSPQNITYGALTEKVSYNDGKFCEVDKVKYDIISCDSATKKISLSTTEHGIKKNTKILINSNSINYGIKRIIEVEGNILKVEENITDEKNKGTLQKITTQEKFPGFLKEMGGRIFGDDIGLKIRRVVHSIGENDSKTLPLGHFMEQIIQHWGKRPIYVQVSDDGSNGPYLDGGSKWNKDDKFQRPTTELHKKMYNGALLNLTNFEYEILPKVFNLDTEEGKKNLGELLRGISETYKKVMGEYPKNYNKFEEPKEEIVPEPETNPTPIPEPIKINCKCIYYISKHSNFFGIFDFLKCILGLKEKYCKK